jgi:ribosomal protein S18 acetylase RimI-like enzyme
MLSRRSPESAAERHLRVAPGRVFTGAMCQTGELRLERASPADATQVWELQRAAFEEYLGFQHPPPSVWRASVADVQQWLQDGGGLLARLGDTLVGSIVWSYRGPVFYVQHVSVHPAHRRRGVASCMMTWLEAEARREGYAKLGLRIRSAQTGNQALYEGLGFAVTDTVPHPLGGPETLTGMEKQLHRML